MWLGALNRRFVFRYKEKKVMIILQSRTGREIQRKTRHQATKVRTIHIMPVGKGLSSPCFGFDLGSRVELT